MVKHSMDLLELLRKRGMDGDVDFLREALRVLVDGIMDAEVSAQIGAQHSERSPERVTYRNGYRNRYRNRTWDTRVGTMEFAHSQAAGGQLLSPACWNRGGAARRLCWPSSSKPTWKGVSTRRVDDLIKALGCDGISSSQVSRICEQLDEVVDSCPGSSPGRRSLPLRLAGRPDPAGAGGRSHRQRLRGGGDGGQCRRAA